jgi:hypothetical protein
MNIFRRIFGPPLSATDIADVEYAAKREFSHAYEVLVITPRCIKVTTYNSGLSGGLETETYQAYDGNGGSIEFRIAPR